MLDPLGEQQPRGRGIGSVLLVVLDVGPPPREKPAYHDLAYQSFVL
ncbi:hypothetical protein ACFU98_47130 [Streptomyces sp. NPDC057575]